MDDSEENKNEDSMSAEVQTNGETPSHITSFDDDDVEDEEIIVTKKKVKRNIIEDSEDEDENIPIISSTAKREVTKNNTDDDSNDFIGNDVLIPNLKAKELDNSQDSMMDGHNESDARIPDQVPTVLSNDIFDAEMDSSDSENEDTNCTEESGLVGREGQNDSPNEEEDEDETEMSAALRRRLAKGAAKKPAREKSGRVSKPRREDIQDMHSETQRIVRESDVRLPYHQPEKKGLSAFLAKAQKKQESYQLIQSRGKHWKNLDVSLAVTSDDTSSSMKGASIDSSVNKSEEADNGSSIMTQSESPEKKGNTQINGEKTDMEVAAEATKDLNEDELPDLLVEIFSKPSEINPPSLPETGAQVSSANVPSATEIENELMCIEINHEETTNSLDDKQSKVQQDSGYLTTPANSSEEENSGDCHSTPNKINKSDLTVTPKHKSFAATSLTPKIASLEVAGPAPRLSGGFDDFIDLDQDNSSKTPAPESGVERLMERFLKHSSANKNKQQGGKDIEISTVHKDCTDTGKEELKLDTFVYHAEEHVVDDHSSLKPGAKLVTLKENLKLKIKEKRNEIRKEREDMETMNNEEGYADILDDDGDFSDRTDTESEGEEEPDEDEIMNELYGAEEDEDSGNPFIDEEADDDDEDCDNEDSLHLQLDDGEDKNKSKDFLKKAMNKHKTMDLDDDENTPTDTLDNSQASNSDLFATQTHSNCETDVMDDDYSTEKRDAPDKETNYMSDSSFDFSSSLIPAGQGDRCVQRNTQISRTPDILTPDSRLLSSSSLFKSGSKIGELSLPIEDTQDLVNSNFDEAGSPADTPQSEIISPKLRFDEDTESQMLDSDGLLKVDSDKKPRRQLVMDELDNDVDDLLALCSGKFTGASQGDGNTQSELLGLCSGKFVPTQQVEKSLASSRGFFSLNGESESATQNMEDIRDLCSGQFPATQTETLDDEPDSPVKIIRRKKSRVTIVDEDSSDSIRLAADADRDSDASEALDSDEDLGVEEEDEEELQRKSVKTFLNKGKLRQEFVDDEAQLSSDDEPDSDEDWDLDAKDDILDKEAGDDDKLNDDDLRNQVGRVHLKTMIDDDAKEIRLMKEMYLPDGDLHDDGGGRQRKFKWRNIDDDGEQDDAYNSDNDGEGEENEEDATWRKQRYERERFLEEQRESGAEEKDSEIKIGKSNFRLKRDSSTSSASREALRLSKVSNLSSPNLPTPKSGTLFKVPQSHGSFLCRGKNQLAKIAEMTKPLSNVGGPRHSRSFVFQTMTEDEKKEHESKKPQVKRSSSVDGKTPPPKRVKLERSTTLPIGSIFNHLG